MKTKIIFTALTVIFSAALAYEGYTINKVSNQSKVTYTVLEMMGTADAQGITGFDKLVAQSLQKMQPKK